VSNGLIIDAYIASINGTTDFTVHGNTLASQPTASVTGILYDGQNDISVRSVTDITTSLENRMVESAAANFTQADVGRRIRITSRDMPLNRTVTGTVGIVKDTTSHTVLDIDMTPLDIGCRITVYDTAIDQFVLDSVIATVTSATEFTTILPAIISSSSATVKIYRQSNAANWLLTSSSESGAFVVQGEVENTLTGASIGVGDVGRRVLVYGTVGIVGTNPVLDDIIEGGAGYGVITSAASGGCDDGTWYIYELIASPTEYYTAHDTVVDTIIDSIVNESTAVIRAKPLWQQTDGLAEILYSPLLVQAVGIPALPTDLCDAIDLAPEIAEDVIVKIASVLRGEMPLQTLIDLGNGTR
jgi:hypothetical protein